MNWQSKLIYNPVPALIGSGFEPIVLFAKRDLLNDNKVSIRSLWDLKYPQTLLRKQASEGYWEYPGKGLEYRLLQTFKNCQTLIYQFGFDRSHPAMEKACEYLLSYQTDEGDIRGFIGNQYAPYYTAIVTCLLNNAGYQDDARITKALEWLLTMRQGDGGWVMGSPGILGIPNLKWKDLAYLTSDENAETMNYFDRTKPFSHSGTGMVIRAFASHPVYKDHPEIPKAAVLLKGHFFKEDNYSSYQSAEHWTRFDYPFWWNNLVAALDSTSLLGLNPADPDINRVLDWLKSSQRPDGLWEISYSGIHKASENSKSAELRMWITLAICRIFKRFFEP